ncbi:MAG: glycoside hydrolase family 9 protein [Chloroflexi bacterium]|nr:glycoside hydrolase family 9 protein [Chloroflexota bacterium]
MAAAALGCLGVLPGVLAGHPVAASTAPSEIRVDQLGYAIEGAKRAYLMTENPITTPRFDVETSNHTVAYSAPVGLDAGSWSATYQHVYVLDFSGFERAGTYHVVVPGSGGATSVAFRVDTPENIYAAALANSLSFYENERDGPDFIPSALRTAPAHLNDEDAMTYLIPAINSNDGFSGDLTPLGKRIDASGAWWDAGDYLKFVETDSYVVGMMETGVRDFPGQMGQGSATSNYTAEAAFGLDFLSRMWDDSTRTLYIEVGIAEGNDSITGDHDIWRLPQADDTYGGNDPSDRYIRNRPVFRAGPPGSLISPNLAGRLAADFALCYQLERTTEPAQARQCLTDAEHIFDLANPNPGQLQTAIAFDFYPEVEWRDDMEWGATELYDALAAGQPPSGLPHRDSTYYLKAAAHWAHAYITGPNDAADTLNLYDVSGLAHFELYRALQHAGDPAGLEVTRGQLLSDLEKQLDNAGAQSVSDPFGFGFPWDQFDTTSHGEGLAVMASEYDWLTHSDKFAAYAADQLGNILGANAWGTSLIVGDGSTFPDCMQHQVTNLVGSLNGKPPILAGASVEGPNSFAATGVVTGMKACPPNGSDRFAQFNSATAVYQDNVQSWSTVEPALDLTVASPLAFSWQIAAAPAP